MRFLTILTMLLSTPYLYANDVDASDCSARLTNILNTRKADRGARPYFKQVINPLFYMNPINWVGYRLLLERRGVTGFQHYTFKKRREVNIYHVILFGACLPYDFHIRAQKLIAYELLLVERPGTGMAHAYKFYAIGNQRKDGLWGTSSRWREFPDSLLRSNFASYILYHNIPIPMFLNITDGFYTE